MQPEPSSEFGRATGPFDGEAAGTLRRAGMEKSLASLPLGLWRKRIMLRAADATGDDARARTSFDDRFVRVPACFEGFEARAAERLFKAAITHAGAHIEYSGERRQPKSLRPIQIAIISILEDSRAELMAARKYPGLLALWTAFHTATGERPGVPSDGLNRACHAVADSVPVTSNLLARLARALIDAAYEDVNPWIQKGREMFREAGPGWEPDDLRRIGVLLGNDLGQMRLQFNAKTYVVEPAYRDDNSGLWDFADPPDAMAEDVDMVTTAARVERKEDATENAPHQAVPDFEEVASKHKPVSPDDDRGAPVRRLPEWDYLASRERPDWVTIIEPKPRIAPAHIISGILERHAVVAARIENLVRQSKIGQTKRLKRQAEGDRLDLDACIQHKIERRAGRSPDIGLYETKAFSQRDLSVLVLLDISESTKTLVNGTATSIFHLERDATALLAQAMHGMGDPFAIHAFCSDGRSDLKYRRIKSFGAPYGDHAKSRLAGLRPGYSTRMGGALRHAGEDLSVQRTQRKLLLVVTDGEPSDVDVEDPEYLTADARKAVIELAGLGVDVFAVGLGDTGQGALRHVFGQRNAIEVRDLASLPERLPLLYFRLVG